MAQAKKNPAENSEVSVPTVIDMSQIVLPSWWNRDKPGSLKGLITSIKQEGQQVPVLVRSLPKNKYLLVDGRRRYMALKEMNVPTIRIAPVSGDAEKDYLNSLIINLQREGHNPMEKARVYRELSESGMKNKDIAKGCGDVSEGSISQHLAFFELPAKMQRSLREEKITPGHARQLLRVNEEEDLAFQEKLYDKMAAHSLSVSDAEEVAAHYVHRKEEKAQAKASKAKGASTGKKGGAAKSKVGASAARKVNVTNYDDYDIKLLKEERIREHLAYYEGMRVKTRSPRKQSHYKGVLLGIELVSGITEFED